MTEFESGVEDGIKQEMEKLRIECPSLYYQIQRKRLREKYGTSPKLPVVLGGALRFLISVAPAIVIAVGVPLLAVALGSDPRGFMATGFGPIVGFLLGLPSGMFAFAWVQNDYDL